MLSRWSLLGLTLLWPLGVQRLAEPLLYEAERAGVSLGALYSAKPASAKLNAEPSLALGDTPLHVEEFTPGQEPLSENDADSASPDDVQAAKATTHKRRTVATAGKPNLVPPKKGLRVNRATILQLARQRVIPRGEPVQGEHAVPSGIRLSGVSAFGVGVQDGDVLTHVSGMPVADTAQVIGAVLGALNRKQEQISARFWRNGEPWALVVELPQVETPAGTRSGEAAQAIAAQQGQRINPAALAASNKSPSNKPAQQQARSRDPQRLATR